MTDSLRAHEVCKAMTFGFASCRPDWATSRALLSDPNFVKMLQEFAPGSISDSQIDSLARYIDNPDLLPEKVNSVAKV